MITSNRNTIQNLSIFKEKNEKRPMISNEYKTRASSFFMDHTYSKFNKNLKEPLNLYQQRISTSSTDKKYFKTDYESEKENQYGLKCLVTLTENFKKFKEITTSYLNNYASTKYKKVNFFYINQNRKASLYRKLDISNFYDMTKWRNEQKYDESGHLNYETHLLLEQIQNYSDKVVLQKYK